MSNIKIGIYTFQNAINIGAYLQAVALLDVVKDILEEEDLSATIYHPYKLSLFNQRYDILTRHTNKIKFNCNRYKKFCESQRIFQTVEDSQYDISIYGSDSIWDLSERTNGYIPQMFGVGVNSVIKVSYAASFGTLTDISRLPQEAIDSLKTFNCVGVRDCNSQRILKEAGINSEITIDPTLLADVHAYLKNEVLEKDYILIYGTFPLETQNEIRETAKYCGKKLLSVGTYNPWCDSSIAVSPIEFVAYVNNADCVITSMYHGSLVSMLLHKPFVSYFTDKRMSKVEYTFDTLGVRDRVLGEEKIIDLMNREIDYENFEKIRQREKIKSKDFLRKVLSEIRT